MTTDNALAPIEHIETGITRGSLQNTANQLALLEEFVSTVLKPNADYGVIPGTDKPTLLKPGAANVIAAFQCHSEPHVDHHDIDHGEGFENYTVHVDVVHTTSGKVVARGFGSCNSYEKKYRYREEQRKCPHCNQPAIIKGKAEYGGGWLCWNKRGGCGAKFSDGDPAIEQQTTGQIENPDPLDQSNTYLKMAIKRAEVDAALRLPGVARFFTQDLEDIMGVAETPVDNGSTSPKTGGAPSHQESPPNPRNAPKPTQPKGQPAPSKEKLGQLNASRFGDSDEDGAAPEIVTLDALAEYVAQNYSERTVRQLTDAEVDEVTDAILSGRVR